MITHGMSNIELDLSGFGQGQGAFCCEGGNKHSGSINAGNILFKRRAISFSRILLHGVS
jgi:hypothetical protein